MLQLEKGINELYQGRNEKRTLTRLKKPITCANNWFGKPT
jgi:hypothetical protein